MEKSKIKIKLEEGQLDRVQEEVDSFENESIKDLLNENFWGGYGSVHSKSYPRNW